MSRVIEKLLLFLGLCSRLREAMVFDLVFFVSAKLKVNFQLCSRLREALVFDLVFFASAKLKSELSALLSASGSLGL